MSSLPSNSEARLQSQQPMNGRGSPGGGRGFPPGGRGIIHQNQTPMAMLNAPSRGGMAGSLMQPLRGVPYNHQQRQRQHHPPPQHPMIGGRIRGGTMMGGIPPPPPPMMYGRGIPPPPPLPPPPAPPPRGLGPHLPLHHATPPFYPHMSVGQQQYPQQQGNLRCPPPPPPGVMLQLHPPPPPPPIQSDRHSGSFVTNQIPAHGASLLRPPPPTHLLPPPLHHPLANINHLSTSVLSTSLFPSLDPRHEFRRQHDTTGLPPIQPSIYLNNRRSHSSFPGASSIQSHVTSIPAHTAVEYTQEQLEQAWTEFKPPDGGAAYYYNTLTSKSQWDKPAAIQRREAAELARDLKESAHLKWNEFTDTNTGKKYYSNGTTTTWSKPDDWKDEAQHVALTEASTEPPQKRKKTVKVEAVYSNKEECLAAFKGLLLAKEISPSMKWNDVVKLCSPDTRWGTFEDVLSVGERKQCLAEYQAKRTNELRDIERQEKARAKDAFLRLLNVSLPTLSGFSAWTSRFEEVREALSKDDRFHAVATDAIRESLFFDYCEESKKRDERNKRNKRKEAHDSLLAFFKVKEEDGILSFASTWASFYASLSNEDRSDPRLATSTAMADADRQLYFADYVIELQVAEDEKRSRIRAARRRTEQAQREAFETALKDLAVDGNLVPSARWRNVESLISSLPSYGPVFDQDREAPREIFEDFVAAWNEVYRWDRSVLNQLVCPGTDQQLVFPVDMGYDEFTKAVLEAAATSASPDIVSQVRRIISRSDPVSSARVYLQELLQKNISRHGVGPSSRGSSQRRVIGNESSSEDEGEILEE